MHGLGIFNTLNVDRGRPSGPGQCAEKCNWDYKPQSNCESWRRYDGRCVGPGRKDLVVRHVWQRNPGVTSVKPQPGTRGLAAPAAPEDGRVPDSGRLSKRSISSRMSTSAQLPKVLARAVFLHCSAGGRARSGQRRSRPQQLKTFDQLEN